MTPEERVLEAGYDNVLLLDNFSYDGALIGITTDNRAVYDFNKMVEWLMQEEGWTEIESIEWIEYNTIRALSYAGQNAPLVMYPLEMDKEHTKQ